MKIIFLDIDGVLNGYNKWNLLGWKIVKKINYKPLILFYKRYYQPFTIHESKVKRLAKIINKTNAKVVMSSSWKHGWWNTPYKDQFDDQKRLTDLLNKYNIKIIDITPNLQTRGEEINSWLINHPNVTNFVILDDEISDMEMYMTDKRLIQTSNVPYNEVVMGNKYEDVGLKNKHVKKAIKILMEEAK